MAVTAVNVPINQGIFVQAAENENTAENGKVFYSGNKEFTTDRLGLMMEAYKKI